jgi:hypothetical protein
MVASVGIVVVMTPQLHGAHRLPVSQAALRTQFPYRRMNIQEKHMCSRVNAVMHDKPSMLGEQMRPDREGRFGSFGGRYVPETLIPALTALVEDYESAAKDPQFQVRCIGELALVGRQILLSRACVSVHLAAHCRCTLPNQPSNKSPFLLFVVAMRFYAKFVLSGRLICNVIPQVGTPTLAGRIGCDTERLRWQRISTLPRRASERSICPSRRISCRDLLQAGRPESHRSTQDKQLARASIALQAHGQKTNNRRNGGGTAWSGYCYCVC